MATIEQEVKTLIECVRDLAACVNTTLITNPGLSGTKLLCVKTIKQLDSIARDDAPEQKQTLAPLLSTCQHKDGRTTKVRTMGGGTRDVFFCPACGGMAPTRDDGPEAKQQAGHPDYSPDQEECVVKGARYPTLHPSCLAKPKKCVHNRKDRHYIVVDGIGCVISFICYDCGRIGRYGGIGDCGQTEIEWWPEVRQSPPLPEMPDAPWTQIGVMSRGEVLSKMDVGGWPSMAKYVRALESYAAALRATLEVK